MAMIRGVFEERLRYKINNCNILIVGAGGIGCEIVKNLVLCGFSRLFIIDFDTIDVSNLNRQFLFHKEHVGLTKAEVAKESALSFNSYVEITAVCDSILSKAYSFHFFSQFDLVLNALDNREARNHVNQMCIFTNVPLIESGTAGYNGQVELIKGGVTQCYECTPKATQKSYPGCTIRNTPSEPIHCIVWAKHLFNQLFGEYSAEEDVSPDIADPEAVLGGVITPESDLDKRISTRVWAQECCYDPEKIFNKVFFDDIHYLLKMANLWRDRKAPKPIKWGQFAITIDDESEESTVLKDQVLWNIQQCCQVFEASVIELRRQFARLKVGDHLVWDKDDQSAMNFVGACANIRSHIFKIERQTLFDIKSMAGNIIPAIATTNAITAGVVVMHAFKVLLEQYNKCQSVYMRLRPNARNQILVPDRFISPPNPKCPICSKWRNQVILKINTEKIQMITLKDDILMKLLKVQEPEVIIEGKSLIVLSSEEGETDCNNNKFLSQLDINDGCVLRVDDFAQNFEFNIIITHIQDIKYELIYDKKAVVPKPPEPEIEKVEKTTQTDNDDDVIVCEAEDSALTKDVGTSTEEIQNPLKRKIEVETAEPSAKKTKVNDEEEEDEEDTIIIN